MRPIEFIPKRKQACLLYCLLINFLQRNIFRAERNLFTATLLIYIFLLSSGENILFALFEIFAPKNNVQQIAHENFIALFN